MDITNKLDCNYHEKIKGDCDRAHTVTTLDMVARQAYSMEI